MFIHVDIVKEMKSHLKDLADLDEPSDEWLGSIPDEFEKLSNLIQEDLVKPTANLSDLVCNTPRSWKFLWHRFAPLRATERQYTDIGIDVQVSGDSRL